MRKIELRPLSTPKPGYGQLVIIGGNATGAGMSVDIQRNQDEHFLQDNGRWGSHPFKFELPALQTDSDGNQTAVVDKQIVDPLLENPHATNMVRFYGPDGAELGRARIKIARDLISSGASGNTPSLVAGAALNTSPEPPPAQPIPEPALVEPEITAAPPEPPKETKSGGRRWLWVALAALLLLIILAAAAWFALSMRHDEPNESEAIQEEPLLEEEPSEPEEEAENEAATEDSSPQLADPDAGEDTALCSLQRMNEQSELEFIQACTAADSDTSAMIDVIGEALANEHCGIARRLYANEALNGDIEAAIGYARQFDPEQHSPSACFPEPDTETAIFWYETAQGIDADNTEANQRLEALQQ
ncbi:hypothetical protein J7J47_08215 [Halomonas sp. ISL-60]|uniref:hypothetical protein n=1 Tax=Halomonas sp. ISL-56 TaxID=2819149 RepID=UPI001BE7650F|nr:hypothetical protein [Halomonas sp. ISL-56]MBT2772214.1 hypothetical protein [Halomonas sp. ISL-60]MBT2803027.1 hypothetical protein [Halomonas sp. ISL-56]